MRFLESIIILVTIISFFSSIDALFGFGNKKKEVDKVTCYYMRLRLSRFYSHILCLERWKTKNNR